MIQVIWTTEVADASEEWEYDWIRNILGDVEYSITMNPHMDVTPQPNCVIVYNTKTDQRVYAFQKFLAGWTYPFGLIHISDEYYASSYEPYLHPKCVFVYRNYFHPSLANIAHVRFFPLGYKKGFLANTTWTGDKYIWSFAGKLNDRHPDRAEGCRAFWSVKPNNIVIEEGDSFSNVQTGLSTPAYCDSIAASQFVLCPIGGFNIDSFRLCEALEIGSVPIVKSISNFQTTNPNYFQCLFGTCDLPFVICETWQECKTQVQSVSEEDYVQMRERCVAFWSNYKKSLRERIRGDVEKMILRTQKEKQY